MFPSQLEFDPENPQWAQIPARAGIFALLAADPKAEPYLGRSPNLRRRLRRLLDARPDQSKRLRLARAVARIEYALTGSEFEAQLRLYGASLQAFGERARKRLHLRPPVLLRMSMENAYPRVYVTNKVTKRALADLFGPWPSRAAAETALEAMLNLFELRRCVENLDPDPAFPGCVYSEMKKCLAPCFQGCTDERYAEEAAAVHAFLATRGESLIGDLARRRDGASTELDFERAGEIHARLAKVEAAAGLMPRAVHALADLNGVIVQPSSQPEEVALFLLRQGALAGPVAYSVAGMRHQNEESGSSSLFAQPTAIQPVPLDESGAAAVQLASRDELESRLDEALAALEERFPSGAKAPSSKSDRTDGLKPVPFKSQVFPQPVKPAPFNAQGPRQTADHLSLFARWHYRPQAKRVGEVCFMERDDGSSTQANGAGVGRPSKKALLRAISRVYREHVSNKDTSAISGPSGPSSA